MKEYLLITNEKSKMAKTLGKKMDEEEEIEFA